MIRLLDQFSVDANDEAGGRDDPLARTVSGIAELAMQNAGFAEIAQYAADGLTDLMPQCGVFAVECLDQGRGARVVAGANMPFSWVGKEFRPGEAMLVAKALREPGSIHQARGVD